MRPAPFSFARPRRLDDALVALAEGAAPLAGGQSLLQAMRLRQDEPAAVVDITRIAELDRNVTVGRDSIRIGALVTHRDVAEHREVRERAPWLSEAAETLGDVQVRNRGTTLGNLCWADPRANMAVALAASNARVLAAHPDRGTFEIAVDDFFSGFRQNTLEGALATSIEIPVAADDRGTYIEFSRQQQDLALVNVCAVASSSGLRIAAGGIHAKPVRLTAIEKDPTDQTSFDSAFGAEGLTPVVDHYGSADYKLELARTLVQRALQKIGVSNSD